MNWKLKAHVLALLSRLPGGHQLYQRLQRWSGSSRIDVDFELKKTFELHGLILEAGGHLEGAEILEIGTGWKPFVPFLFALGGASRVHSFDVNPWLTVDYARETLSAIESRASVISEQLMISESRLLDRIAEIRASSRGLSGMLEQLNIDYRCPADATATNLPKDSIDCVVSSNVLEHIPESTLEAIHRESARILRPGGLSVHRFNPEDHYAEVDRTITGANFLRFSERQWYWYGGSGLAYHNRLRCVEHEKLFDVCGFNTLVSRVRINHRALQAIQTGECPIHEDFAEFSPEELAADYMWIVARAPLREPDQKRFNVPNEVPTGDVS